MAPRNIPEVEPRLLLTVKDAARVLSVGPRSIHRYVVAGKLEANRTLGRTKITRRSIDKLLGEAA
jgi:excisionase family DNA binding protein